jgi:CRISPR-associated protein Cas5a/b/c
LDNPFNFFVLEIELQYHWGFISQVIPFSKSRMAFKVPPPTTLVGALAYPLARILRKPETKDGLSWANSLWGPIRWASAKVSHPIHKAVDISRIYWLHKAKNQVKTDAVAVERVYTISKRPIINVVYMISRKDAEAFLGEKWDDLIYAAAWAMIRMGQKEGMITVLNTSLKPTKPFKPEGKLETEFYFPLRLASLESGEGFFEDFVPMGAPIGEYVTQEKEPYFVPYTRLTSSPVKVKPKETTYAVKVESGHLLIDRSVLGMKK